MNIVIFLVLGIALTIQIVALYLLSRPLVVPDPDVEGAAIIDANPRARRAGSILAIVGVIVATTGSILSLWAPGFS